MKEIEAIQMRKDLKFLKQYGFTDSSISRYVGNISDRAIREFTKNKRTMLNNKNHTILKVWIDETIKTINGLVDDPTKNLTDEEKEDLKSWLRDRKINKALMRIF